MSRRAESDSEDLATQVRLRLDLERRGQTVPAVLPRPPQIVQAAVPLSIQQVVQTESSRDLSSVDAPPRNPEFDSGGSWTEARQQLGWLPKQLEIGYHHCWFATVDKPVLESNAAKFEDFLNRSRCPGITFRTPVFEPFLNEFMAHVPAFVRRLNLAHGGLMRQVNSNLYSNHTILNESTALEALSWTFFDIAHLSKLNVYPNLQRLNLPMSYGQTNDLVQLDSLRSLKHLSELQLSLPPSFSDYPLLNRLGHLALRGLGLSHFRSMTRDLLESLSDLRYLRLSNLTLMNLDELRFLKALQYLNLSSPGSTLNSYLKSLGACKLEQFLHLRLNYKSEKAADYRFLNRCHSLQVLELGMPSVPGRKSEAVEMPLSLLNNLSHLEELTLFEYHGSLTELPLLTKLRSLSMPRVAMRTAEIRRLGAYPSLRQLNIGLANGRKARTGLKFLKDIGLETLIIRARGLHNSELASFGQCESLVELVIRGKNRFTGQALASLVSLPRLRRLHFENAKLDADSLRMLAQIPQLEELVISGDSELQASEADFEDLKQLRLLRLPRTFRKDQRQRIQSQSELRIIQ